MKVPGSAYLDDNKEVFLELQQALAKEYEYASVLVGDGREQRYSVSARGTSITDGNTFGRRSFVIRVRKQGAVAEYAASEISREDIPHIVEIVDTKLRGMSMPFTPCAAAEQDKAKEKICFVKASDYEIYPEDLGDEKIISRLNELRREALGMDERLLDCTVSVQYQVLHRLFLSDDRELEQHLLWTCGSLMVMARRGEELKDSYRGFSGMCGMELLDNMRAAIPERIKTVTDLLDCEPLVPGTYECVCTPDVTGMIVHEAFGHGVEMDMFVKDRALARHCVGQQVASELVTMRDGAAAADEVAGFFFDDEGNLAGNTLIIDHGKLVGGMADELSAGRLGIHPTGNGRRESPDHKAYTRMTNTFFEAGKDSVEDMISSVKNGLLLAEPTSGMEDPKNWGIQAMVSYGREIKDGKLTGRIFSPIVLSGYVPDLLKSITMMSSSVELNGAGACGKGYKEWVKVSDGGPWIKARIRLG